MAGQSITEILDAENFAGRLIDYGILLPRAQSLYEFAALIWTSRTCVTSSRTATPPTPGTTTTATSGNRADPAD
jgi:hypothetical protein